MNPARLRAYIYLLIVIVIWGVAPSVIKFGLGEITPFLFLFYRFAITVIFLLPLYLNSKNKGVNFKTITSVIIGSFLASTATLGLMFLGSNLTTSVDASLISSTTPIFVVLLGMNLLKEHLTKKEKYGILITMLGTLLITFQSVFESGISESMLSILGNLLIFLSNFTFALSLIYAKKDLRKGVSAFSLMFYMFLTGLITILPLTYFESGNWNFITKIFILPFSAHLSVFYMAFLSGALAYFLYQKAQKTIETSEAAIFLYLQPLITAPVGMLWLGEKISLIFIIGSLIIALGVCLAEFKTQRR